MKHWKIYIGVCLLPVYSSAQRANNQLIDLTGAIGKSEAAISGSYVYNWKFGASKKWEAGLGLKISSWFGVKKEFTTAPARLSRSSNTPVLVYFAKTDSGAAVNLKKSVCNKIRAAISRNTQMAIVENVMLIVDG